MHFLLLQCKSLKTGTRPLAARARVSARGKLCRPRRARFRGPKIHKCTPQTGGYLRKCPPSHLCMRWPSRYWRTTQGRRAARLHLPPKLKLPRSRYSSTAAAVSDSLQPFWSHVWGRIPLCGICRWAFECVDLNVRCGRWTARAALGCRGAAAAVGARVWRVASVGARAGAWRECVPFCDNLSL